MLDSVKSECSSELGKRKRGKGDALEAGCMTSGMRKGGRGGTKDLIQVPKHN